MSTACFDTFHLIFGVLNLALAIFSVLLFRVARMCHVTHTGSLNGASFEREMVPRETGQWTSRRRAVARRLSERQRVLPRKRECNVHWRLFSLIRVSGGLGYSAFSFACMGGPWPGAFSSGTPFITYTFEEQSFGPCTEVAFNCLKGVYCTNCSFGTWVPGLYILLLGSLPRVWPLHII